MTNTNEFLSQGIAALKAGQKTQARSLLEQVVQQDERNEMGWLWLSGAVDTDEERRLCLENVLAINPSNNVAQQGLKQLSIKQGVRSLPQSADVPSGTRQVNKAASSKVAQRDESLATSSIERPTRSTSKPHVKRRLPVLGLAFGTVAVCIFTGFMLLGGWYIVSGKSFPNIIKDSPEKAYAKGVRAALTQMDTWIDGPVRKRNNVLAKTEVQGALIMCSDSRFLCTEELRNSLLLLHNASREVIDNGFTVKASFVSLTPLPELQAAHQQVLKCIEQTLSQSQATVAFVEQGIMPPSSLSAEADACTMLKPARQQMEDFIAQAQ